MTEKQYGGSTGRETRKTVIERTKKTIEPLMNKNTIDRSVKDISKVSLKNFLSDEEKIIKAGEITSEVKRYVASIVNPGVPLLELAEKIEAKIRESGGKPAFPVNLSINNIAAHYTPGYDDKTTAYGLLKVDIGIHIDGFIADTAISFDLDGSDFNKKLIKASEEALKNAIQVLKKDISINEIGAVIEKTIESYGFIPIINLSGHSMNQYELHAGLTIPNIDDKRNVRLKEGLYAIEPFATNGSGRVHEGKPSGIYELKSEKNPRSPIAREVLAFIIKEYQTLPFCSRWIIKKLGTRAFFGLKQLEDNGNLYQYPQLVEEEKSKVSQVEQTVLITKEGKVIVTTL